MTMHDGPHGRLYQVWDWKKAGPRSYHFSLDEAKAEADQLNRTHPYEGLPRFSAGEAND